MRRTSLLLLALLVFLTSAVTAAEQRAIDVMSFNIRYGTAVDGDNHWDNREAQVCEVIRDHSPDVVGLQEALGFQIGHVLATVPGYGGIGEGRDGGIAGEYSAILYRTARFNVSDSGTFWLSDTPGVPSSHWGNACVRICTWARFVDRQSGQVFYLYNTHLDHQSQPSREKSVRLIVERIRSRAHADPFVLTGDFNAGEDNPAIRYLAGDGTEADAARPPLLDAFRVLHPDVVEVGTFNGFTGKTDGDKIDYVFVTPETEVLSAEIARTNREGRYPSDHFPVTARLRFATSPEGE